MTESTHSEQGYSGIPNLEVMSEAKNYNQFLLNQVMKYAALTPGQVLDFGAGTGQFAAPARKLGLEITALEPDAHLRQLLTAEGLNVAPDIEHVPDESYSFIYSLNVLEHIVEDSHILARLHSKLQLNGGLLIYVPAFPILFTKMDENVGHVRRYTRHELATKVASAGFRVHRLSYVDSLGFAATLTFKMFGDQSGKLDARMVKLYDRLVFPLSRALDRLFGRLLGKNLLLYARKI